MQRAVDKFVDWNAKYNFLSTDLHTRKYRGVDEDYVNNEENALWASLSQSRNLEVYGSISW